MSTERKLILLAVSVGVLYGISLGVTSSNNKGPVKPTNWWVNVLKSFPGSNHDFAPQQDVAPTNGWENGRWTISNGASNASLVISSSRKAIRRATLAIETGAVGQVEFQPKRSPKKPYNFVDAAALPVTNAHLTKESPMELVILCAGGTLNVQCGIATGMVSLVLTNWTGTARPSLQQ
jgi:hypothetical protein